ncbi:hypothetical protein BB560_001451 [Smittium megazygosporum]|uniref:SUN domain-containing protein n=1 Tax=Smittium megazygosporum TaxID=133381 RepID=A0A2T9ZHK1_9FUNG|nr:hypothetical protein BB560_001451 [Smittium megazygosporum]
MSRFFYLYIFCILHRVFSNAIETNPVPQLYDNLTFFFVTENECLYSTSIFFKDFCFSYFIDSHEPNKYDAPPEFIHFDIEEVEVLEPDEEKLKFQNPENESLDQNAIPSLEKLESEIHKCNSNIDTLKSSENKALSFENILSSLSSQEEPSSTQSFSKEDSKNLGSTDPSGPSDSFSSKNPGSGSETQGENFVSFDINQLSKELPPLPKFRSRDTLSSHGIPRATLEKIENTADTNRVPTRTISSFISTHTQPQAQSPTLTKTLEPEQDDQSTAFKYSFSNSKLPLKDRFNYVSSDCGAVLLNSNKEAKKSSAILSKKKDEYMLNLCSAKNKFFVVELCDEILIDAISIANYEFFSSTLKNFIFSASDRYPPKDNKWTRIGYCTANNTRSNQVFRFSKPMIWAKYVRIDLISHYGDQYYCPISSFAVYGTTQMEKFRYEAEEEAMLSSQSNVPVKVKKPKPKYNEDAAIALHSYINDFEERILGLSLNDAFAIDKSQGGNVLKQINPPLPVNNAEKKSELNESCSSGRVYIKINPEKPTNLADPKSLLSKMNKLNSEGVENNGGGRTHTGSLETGKLQEAFQGSETLVNISPTNSPITGDEGTDQESQTQLNYDKRNTDSPNQNNTPENLDHNNIPNYNYNSKIKPPESDENFGGERDDNEDLLQNSNSHESIYKTITRRLLYLERNMTHIFEYLENQSDYFNEALTKIHLLNIDNINTAISNFNKSTTQQIKAVVSFFKRKKHYLRILYFYVIADFMI